MVNISPFCDLTVIPNENDKYIVEHSCASAVLSVGLYDKIPYAI